MELQEENVVSQNKVIDYIMDYLEEYNSDGKYRYILSFSFGGGILYASDSHDITAEVLRGINEKYESEQEEK
jgi:outer membrane protein